MHRVRKTSELLPPGATVRGASKTETPKRDLEGRIKLLEERLNVVSRQAFDATISGEALKMCLRGLSEMGQIDYDDELFQSALNKCHEILDRDTKKEFEGHTSEEMREIRYQEFKSENFEE